MSAETKQSERQSRAGDHNVASENEWLAARKELLKKEKQWVRLRDELSAERRKLRWVKVQNATYATYGRGVEILMGTYSILDLAPKGRDEDELEFSMAWVRYHDRYGTNEFADADKPYWPETAEATNGDCCCGTAEGRG